MLRKYWLRIKEIKNPSELNKDTPGITLIVNQFFN